MNPGNHRWCSNRVLCFWRRLTYQSLHSAVQSVTVVAAELGVNALQGGVTVGLGLLDTAQRMEYQRLCSQENAMCRKGEKADFDSVST